jgi:gas vesicle protein
MSEQRSGFSSLLWFVAGAAIGAGVALLYAPQSGAETRKKIKDASGKVAEDVKEQYEKISNEAKKSIDQVKATAEKAMSNVKNFFEGAKDSLKKEIIEELEEAPVQKKK